MSEPVELHITRGGLDALDAAGDAFREKLFKRAEQYAKDRGSEWVESSDVAAAVKYATECEEEGVVKKALETWSRSVTGE